MSPMTIATHCLGLIRAHGPSTPQELGEACRRDGVTTARDPANSVSQALAQHHDGGIVRVGARFHLTAQLLDGRWLSLPRPLDPRAFDPKVDLEPMAGLARRPGIPLTSGGSLHARDSGSWTGPDGWAPVGEVLGLRLCAGTLEVRVVEVDEMARACGLQLADRVMAGVSLPYGLTSQTTSKQAESLLCLLAEDEQLLRAPVAPLSWFLPQPLQHTRDTGHGGGWPPTVQLSLPPALYERLQHAADADDLPIQAWLVSELSRLASWPPDGGPPWSDDGRRYGRDHLASSPDHDEEYDDPYERLDDGVPASLVVDRWPRPHVSSRR